MMTRTHPCLAILVRKQKMEAFMEDLSICRGQKHEKLSPTKPSSTSLSSWTPVFCKHHQASDPPNKTLHPQHPNCPFHSHPHPPKLKSCPREIPTLLITIPRTLFSGLFPSYAVTSGCQQATTVYTDGSPGPVMASTCHIALVSRRFFYVFLSISHLSLCFPL